MHIHFHSNSINAVACDDTLSIDSIRIYNTAEHTWHRMLLGIYSIALGYSKIHSHKMFRLVEVPNACFATGNSIWSSTDSCIPLGTYRYIDLLCCFKQSQEALIPLWNCLDITFSRGNEVTISKTEEPHP